MPETMRLASDEQRRALPRRFNFTVKTISAVRVPPEKDRVWVYDSRARGLAYMLTDSGASSFYYYGKVAGRPIRYRLGDGTISIEQARTLAAGALGKVAAGVDPQAERKTARAEWTFKQLFDWWMTNHARPRLRTADELQQKFDKHLAGWGGRKFASISRTEVARLHAKIGEDSPGAANRLLALISSVFNRARDIDFKGINPALGIRKFAEQQRERYMLPDELQRFYKALRSKKLPQDMRDFFALLLLTGVRAGNLTGAAWSEFNLESNVWTIPGANFKTGRPHSVALVAEAIIILKRRQSDDSTFVFPGDGATGHLVEYKGAWQRFCKLAQLDDLHVHDIRHTHATYLAASGANLSAIGRALGHRELSTTTRYIQLDLEPIRAAVGAGVAAMVQAGRAKGR